MKPEGGHQGGTTVAIVSRADDVLQARSQIDSAPNMCGVVGLYDYWTADQRLSWELLVLVLPFLIVVVRVMPSDFESASSEGDRDQPPCEENGENQGQRRDVHRPSPK